MIAMFVGVLEDLPPTLGSIALAEVEMNRMRIVILIICFKSIDLVLYSKIKKIFVKKEIM